MSDFQRYAIYYLPDDRALASFGAAWLGWDVEHGRDVAGLSVEQRAAMVAKARVYGFHATLKPPFRLVEGATADALQGPLTQFAAARAPVALGGLCLTRLGGFLALVPVAEVLGITELAFDVVKTFDRFRRPADAAELSRRRASGLSARQDALLMQWGYPYVADEFRFHLTLTDPLDTARLMKATEAVKTHLPKIARPFEIASIALVGERTDGRFQMIQRYALQGKAGSGGGI